MSTETVRSKDGTTIAFSRAGSGPALIFVDGALCCRGFGPAEPMAKELAPHFTVITYDRRGRGESSNTQPYSVEREVEDLDALIQAAGGSAYVVGVSSGAALALEAANRGLAIKKVAVYEAPFIVDDTRTPIGEDFLPQLKQLIAADNRSAAVKQFMKAVQVPAIGILMMQLMPAWRKLKAVAPTLVHDITIVGPYQHGKPLPAGRWSSITQPTLVMDGSKSPEWMRNAQRALARVVPGAKTRTLDGQTHMVNAKVLAPAVSEFFTATQ
jgi:pimeloyl-ACP methyl ester carboxylesterase